MSIHSTIAAAATSLLVAIQGETGEAAPVVYQPSGRQAFRWEGSSHGTQQGGWQEQPDTGNILKVTRLTVQGPTAALIAGGVTELDIRLARFMDAAFAPGA